MSQDAAATLAQIVPVFLLALTVERRLSQPRSRRYDIFVLVVVVLLVFVEAGMIALVIDLDHWLGWLVFLVIGLALAATITPHVTPLVPGLNSAAVSMVRTRQQIAASIRRAIRRPNARG